MFRNLLIGVRARLGYWPTVLLFYLVALSLAALLSRLLSLRFGWFDFWIVSVAFFCARLGARFGGRHSP